MHFNPSKNFVVQLSDFSISNFYPISQRITLYLPPLQPHPLISLLEGNFNIIQCSKLSPETEKAALREVKIAQGFAPGSVVFCTQSLGTQWGVIHSEGAL